MRIAAALFTDPSPRVAGANGAADALASLEGESPELAVIFTTRHHAQHADAVLKAVRSGALYLARGFMTLGSIQAASTT